MILNDSFSFIVLQTQLAFFFSSRNKQVILDSFWSEYVGHYVGSK